MGNLNITSEQLDKESQKLYNDVIITDFTTCYHCKSKGLKDEDYFCPNCRFPQRGDQIEMKKYLIAVKRKKRLYLEHKKAIKKARNILFILGTINLVFGLILGMSKMPNSNIILVACLICAAIYFGLGFWSQRKPFAAILSGFFIYIVLNVVAAVQDPNTIYQGIIWKVIIISGFVYGYKGAKDSEGLEKELKSLTDSKDLS
ncbi:MAG: hypothetical protein CVU11_00395 [Bacteroidetes bacterium HGW-Bacteroidetes-6]|jgi:predicted membrane protein|nr:MAG: hypothetical protein CVU11_00395 [Bacteroidetes bacterium HGW-Bacteroidetes-6]